MNNLALILSLAGTNQEELDNRPTHAQAIAIAKENRATIYYPIADKKRACNNLGWLLRHWKDLEHLEIISSFCGKDGECVLVGKVWVSYWGRECYYITKFASRTVCEDWIDRQVFHGVKIIKTDMKYSDEALTLCS